MCCVTRCVGVTFCVGYMVFLRSDEQAGADNVNPALGLVQYAPPLQPAMAYVFGNTFVCSTSEAAKTVLFIQQVLQHHEKS